MRKSALSAIIEKGVAIHDPHAQNKGGTYYAYPFGNTPRWMKMRGDVHTVNTPPGAQEMSIVRVSAEVQGCSYSDVTFSYTGKSGRQTQTKRDVH